MNDVRIDNPRQKAYISESGLGAIIVLDLQTGQSRRLLDEHPSTKAEHVTVTIDGEEWIRPDGSRPKVNCDGIALHPTGEWVYYQVLTGYKLHRIKVEDLLNDSLDVLERASKVEYIDSTGVADGIIFDADGNLYLTALQHNAINRYTVDGVIETVAQDKRISWPDSFARGSAGRIYFTTSQIQAGANPPGPYRLFVLEPKS
jgi:sugar lactone lactonase YvrE